MSDQPRVVRNEWSTIRVSDLGAWQPTLPVSVVIPAYQCQESLDLTLAALTRQTYPSDLLEVLVVDDGSQPRLRLPPLRPASTRLIWAPDHSDQWGIANACNVGVRESTGEVILRLDADMVVFPEHVEAHARWHHQLRYAVTLGTKLFIDVEPGRPGWPSVGDAAADAENLFDRSAATPHEYLDRLLERTDQLRAADHLGFLAHVGATVAVHRDLFEAAGGYDVTLRRGEDTEFGYRLAQAGAVFVPEPLAQGWHLGLSGMMRDETRLRRAARPFLADRVPYPRWLRDAGGTGWSVPLITAVMDVTGHPYERVRTAADAVLNSDVRDLRLHLVGEWTKLTDEPRSMHDDPLLDLRLIAATYRSDPRVTLSEQAPASAFPAPYLLRVPATAGVSAGTVRRLIDEAEHHQAGLVRVRFVSGAEEIALWRTAALGRAGRLGGDRVAEVVAETFGLRELTPASAGVIDLTGVATSALGSDGTSVVRGLRPQAWLPSSVEVAGVRSWGRATVVVAALAGRRARSVIRRGLGRR